MPNQFLFILFLGSVIGLLASQAQDYFLVLLISCVGLMISIMKILLDASKEIN